MIGGPDAAFAREKALYVGWLVAAVLLALVLACQDDGTRASDKRVLGLHVQKSWASVRGAPGHRVHVVHHQVKCESCHDLSGDEVAPPGPEPCRKCHEKESAIVHDAPAAMSAFGPSATAVCTDCHEFSEAQAADAGAGMQWDCARCHLPNAESGAVIVHRDADCRACHTPHETPRASAPSCDQCHNEIRTSHASKGKNVAEVCTTCHENLHAPASPARATCVPCHAAHEPKVPKTALFSEGHTECTGCHRPHEYEASKAVDCKSCHAEIHTMAKGVAEHQRCTSCHDAHDVRRDPSRACETCHGAQKTNHPPVGTVRACTSCHEAHPRKAGAPRARTCSGCHQGAASDHAFHAGNLQCTACHTPHHFVLEGTTTALCEQCHERQLTLTKRSLSKGHERCEGCHTGVPHQPSGPRASCGSCHLRAVREVTLGHSECRKCHEPHAGAVSAPCRSCHQAEHRTAPSAHQDCRQCHEPHAGRKTKTCASCHSQHAGGVHATKVQGSCESCHRAHGPKGVEKPPACRSCHDTPLPALHTVRKHGECEQCHSAHQLRRTPERPICLTCHTDRTNHYPDAERCSGCHLFRAP